MLKKKMSSTSGMEDNNSRHYQNNFPDFSVESSKNIINLSENNIDEIFRKQLLKKLESFLSIIEKNSKEWNNQNDNSIYTGNCGIVYLYYFIARQLEKPHFTEKSMEILIKNSTNESSCKKRPSFLTGSSGVCVTTALLQKTLKDDEAKINETLSNLSNIFQQAIAQDVDELLYGKSGYLYSLLFSMKNISKDSINTQHIQSIIKSILIDGINYSRNKKCKSPLMYSWHDKEYLGGAHGLAGILFILLQAREYVTDDDLNNLIEPSICYLMKIRFSSGNFPSSVGNYKDRLVHWCHGAPSMTMLFILAHQVFGKAEYLRVAEECGEIIWKRGLLKKGCGLCHGVAGNAYSFLCLFNYTKDPKYLYHACRFAEWCFDYELHQNRIPDRPYSLFEGLSGIIYFLADLLKPSSAKFPGYEL